jgi:hypothetical protein
MRYFSIPLLALLVTVTLLPACGSENEDTSPQLEPRLWPAKTALVPSGRLVTDHPAAFKRISRWGTHVSGPVATRPDIGHRGSFGTGNGNTFAFVGLADPLNTLHSLTTPTYERRPRFFGDYSVRLAPAGEAPLVFGEEWAARSLSARVLLTRGKAGTLRLDTFDFAPQTGDAALRSCFLRVLVVTNDGDQPSADLDLVVTPARRTTEAGAGRMQETTEQRNLTTGFLDGDVRYESGRLIRRIPALAPGAEDQSVLFHCGSNGTRIAEPPRTIDVGALLDIEAALYSAWEEQLLQIDVPDPMVADLVDGMKMTLAVQTSAGGATCPMSRYTRTWTRDNIGPVLALLQLGGHDDVARMLDYMYAAIVRRGDLANSYDADLDPSNPPPPPNWDALPPLSGRVASESPSYVVWSYGAWYRHTGELERVRDRFGLLRRSLMAQAFGPDQLLPFSGDETYRVAMSVAFDLTLAYSYETTSWSANSTLLWLGAEKHFAELAAALGRNQDVAAAEQKRGEVEAGFKRHYLLPNGCISPFIDFATGKAAERPYEDVALNLTWAGARDGDDPEAQIATACLLDQLRIEPGRVQSPAAEGYRNNFLLLQRPILGVLTGMLPGYTLSTLASVGHPEAEDAFNIMARAASTSGNYQEGLIADDLSGFSVMYDPLGTIGDNTAKFRPWEGGINVAAMLQYLAGFEPDQPNRRIQFRPHLPNDWSNLGLRGFRAGDSRFDLEVIRKGATQLVRITSRAAEEYQVVLRWDSTPNQPAQITVHGAKVDSRRFEHFGMQSWLTPSQTLAAGKTLEFRITTN